MNRPLLISLIALVLSFASIAAVSIPVLAPLLQGPPQPTISKIAGECLAHKPPGYISIIADLNGFNDSVDYLTASNFSRPYPIVEVTQGSTVHILFCNLAVFETFGLAIQHYFEAGAIVTPGNATVITFLAKDPGNYSMYNNILVPVHVFVESGRLVVKPNFS
jgi:hypothetical protein